MNEVLTGLLSVLFLELFSSVRVFFIHLKTPSNACNGRRLDRFCVVSNSWLNCDIMSRCVVHSVMCCSAAGPFLKMFDAEFTPKANIFHDEKIC